MRFSFAIVVFLAIAPAWPQAAPDTDVVGSWEGESKCTVPDSPCHDEHALYRITADKKNPAQLNLDGYKIVAGSPEFMGTLVCQYRAESSTISCIGNTGSRDDWEFHFTTGSITGTLTMGAEKTLYRRITLHKKPAKKN
jgi:hypothetical protein